MLVNLNDAVTRITMADELEILTVETGAPTTGAVIWLHGLGADNRDFEGIVGMLELTAGLRFVFPNAPIRPVTINAGAEMRAWYDANPNDPSGGQAEIAASARSVARLLDAAVADDIPSRRVAIAGFSQGGVIALEVGLAYPAPLAGIMALSTYVHDHEHLAERVGFANVDVPIFMAHGLHDPMIPITRAITAREALLGLNYRVDWHQYAMGHQVCPEEIGAIGAWLNTVLP